MRKLALHGNRPPAATAIATRRRAVQPPVITPCSPLVLYQPVQTSWLAISGDDVYVSDPEAGIFRVPKTGGLRTIVVPTVGMEIGPFVMDATHIYFVTADDEATGSLYKVPISGGAPTQLTTGLAAPFAIAADSTSLYWLNLGTFAADDILADGSVERIGKDGTGRTVLAKDLNAPFTLALDSTDVYFVETGLSSENLNSGVRRVSKSGGAVASVIDVEIALSVAVNATHVFYSAIGAVSPAVNRIAKSGGAPQSLMIGTVALALEVRDSTLYAAAADLSSSTFLVAVPVDGGILKIIVPEGLDSGAMAFDDCMVYYAASQRLERAAR